MVNIYEEFMEGVESYNTSDKPNEGTITYNGKRFHYRDRKLREAILLNILKNHNELSVRELHILYTKEWKKIIDRNKRVLLSPHGTSYRTHDVAAYLRWEVDSSYTTERIRKGLRSLERQNKVTLERVGNIYIAKLILL